MGTLGSLFFLVGPPAAGKSTLTKKIVTELPSCITVSSDAIRAELFPGPWSASDNAAVFAEVDRRVVLAIFDGQNVILDAVNTHEGLRQQAVEKFMAAGVTDIYAIGFDTATDKLLERQVGRAAKGDKTTLEDSYIQVSQRRYRNNPPSVEEGFREVWFYRSGEQKSLDWVWAKLKRVLK